jgi:hypothetical protein
MSPRYTFPLRSDFFAGQLGSLADPVGLVSLLNDWGAPGTGAVFFVGKNGSDSNQGDSHVAPLLTFTKAFDLAQSGDSVFCLDGGVYTEDVIVPSDMNVWAPGATIQGADDGDTVVTIADNTDVVFRKVIAAGDQSAVARSNTPGTGRLGAQIIDTRTGLGNGVFNKGVGGGGGVLIVKVDQVLVGTGTGIGSQAQGVGHTHIECEDIYLYGNGAAAVSHQSGGGIVGRIAHILEQDSPTGTTAIWVAGGRVDLMVGVIAADTTWNVTGAGTLSLFYNQATGTPAGAGTVLLSTPS